MKQLLLIWFLVAGLLYSCKKDCETVIDVTDSVFIDHSNASVRDWQPLTIGSYWIYQYYYRDDSNNWVPEGIVDSVYISGDTIIHNDTFMVFTESTYSIAIHADIISDSGDYIVDEHGAIFFSSTDFTDTLQSVLAGGIYPINYKMDDADSLISLSFGLVSTYNFKGYIESPFCPGIIRYEHNFYAKHIGRVKAALFYAITFCLPEQNWVEEDLLRFYIAPG